MIFPTDIQLRQAIPLRHSVRHYLPTPIPHDILSLIAAEIDRINMRHGYSFKVVVDEPKSFKNIFAYGKFENVRNYIIVSAPRGNQHSRLCGYEGERLVLALQALGLNTCWVGLSYSKNSEFFTIPDGHKIRCVISFGYGTSQGADRKTKPIERLSNATPSSPQWFVEGMKAVQLSPTAINQQKFRFTLRPDGTLTAETIFSMVGYTHIDLGIAIAHFNLSTPEHQISPITLSSDTNLCDQPMNM